MSPDDEEELSSLFDEAERSLQLDEDEWLWYLGIWERGFAILLGWSKDWVAKWAERWKQSGALLTHELPTWYMAPSLIPRELNLSPVSHFRQIADESDRAICNGPPFMEDPCAPSFNWYAAADRLNRYLIGRGSSLVAVRLQYTSDADVDGSRQTGEHNEQKGQP